MMSSQIGGKQQHRLLAAFGLASKSQGKDTIQWLSFYSDICLHLPTTFAWLLPLSCSVPVYLAMIMIFNVIIRLVSDFYLQLSLSVVYR